MMRFTIIVALLASVLPCAEALSISGAKNADEGMEMANPIRKVVNLLQKMAKKIESQGKAEEDLYEKYECYCKKTTKAAEDEIKRLTNPDVLKESDIDASEAELAGAKTDIEVAKGDQEASEKALAEATAQRKAEQEKFDERSNAENATAWAAEQAVDILSRKATPAAEEGAFVQLHKSDHGPVLAQAVQAALANDDEVRGQVMALIQGQSNSGASPDQAIGVLNGIKDASLKTKADLLKEEDRQISQFLKIKSAKAEEIQTLLDRQQRKRQTVQELQLQIVTMKHELKDNAKSLEANRVLLAETEAGCKEKATQWQERQKIRSEEQVALAETIKMLNGDESLDLFKKTLSGSKPALIQVNNEDKIKQSVLKEIEQARRVVNSRPELNFLALALRGKKVDFSKVNKMIDDMIALMATQTKEDEKKKDYCEDSFYQSDRTQSTLKRDIGDADALIKDVKGSLGTTNDEIAALNASVNELDKTTAQASDDRKAAAGEYQAFVAENTVAIQLLDAATNRLNKFYNPQLYKETTTPSPYDPYALIQVKEHRQSELLQAEKPPKTFGDTYVASKDSMPVLGMIQSLQGDLKQENRVAESDEKFAITEYERSMKAAATKRAADTAGIEERQKSKADLEVELQQGVETKAGKESEMAAAKKVEKNLHDECDWLQKNFEQRRAARADEVDSLKRAKASLAGAVR
eukprot:TRINITY_DN79929_c0_g1_i1.p1 TRINITY_DN79929_c0_g1~~TRINITY_DN79929_c0_g1_i1.p1  ORF type:complete len:696 (-),score=218.61 TRINITY_DN79929_c0_g1_i1:99-2186(-)